MIPSSYRCLAVALLTLLVTTNTARADDCPAGSKFKTQDGYSFCEPTVCLNDGQCAPDEVCRPIGLCMQVGTLDTKTGLTDAGQRLVVTQRCAPDKTCPQTTTCSEKERCISRVAADKMGLLTPPAANGATSTTPEKKSSCGCEAVGSSGGAGRGALAIAAAALVLLSRRRRR